MRQLDAVAARLLGALAALTPVVAGVSDQVLLDIDDTIIEVHGYGKQGSGYGYSGVRGLNALLATVTTRQAGAGRLGAAAAPGIVRLTACPCLTARDRYPARSTPLLRTSTSKEWPSRCQRGLQLLPLDLVFGLLEQVSDFLLDPIVRAAAHRAVLVAHR